MKLLDNALVTGPGEWFKTFGIDDPVVQAIGAGVGDTVQIEGTNENPDRVAAPTVSDVGTVINSEDFQTLEFIPDFIRANLTATGGGGVTVILSDYH